MTAQEWGIVIGMAAAATAAIVPWMLLVQARLAVVADRLERLERKLDEMTHHEHDCTQRCVRLETEMRYQRDELARLAEQVAGDPLG
ncbi:hypothetical protein JCM19992_02620 [Thermostilla marina]